MTPHVYSLKAQIDDGPGTSIRGVSPQTVAALRQSDDGEELIALAEITRFNIGALAEETSFLALQFAAPGPEGTGVVAPIKLDEDYDKFIEAWDDCTYANADYRFDELVVWQWIGVTEAGSHETDIGTRMVDLYSMLTPMWSACVIVLPDYRKLTGREGELVYGPAIDPPFLARAFGSSQMKIANGFGMSKIGKPKKRKQQFMVIIDHSS